MFLLIASQVPQNELNASEYIGGAASLWELWGIPRRGLAIQRAWEEPMTVLNGPNVTKRQNSMLPSASFGSIGLVICRTLLVNRFD